MRWYIHVYSLVGVVLLATKNILKLEKYHTCSFKIWYNSHLSLHVFTFNSSLTKLEEHFQIHFYRLDMFLKRKLLTDCWSCSSCYKTSILVKVSRDCRLHTCRKWHLVINAYFYDFYQWTCYYNLLSYILMLFFLPPEWWHKTPNCED